MAVKLRVSLTAPPQSARLRAEGLDGVREGVMQRAVEAAYARGHAEGVAEATEGAARALGAAIEQLERARTSAEDSLPREVVELATEIADQVLRSRLAEGTYDLERIVRSALAGGGVDRGRCLVHLHPKDLDQLRGIAFREDTELVPHSDLARGTVHVETRRGLLVRDPFEALESIRESLLEGLV